MTDALPSAAAMRQAVLLEKVPATPQELLQLVEDIQERCRAEAMRAFDREQGAIETEPVDACIRTVNALFKATCAAAAEAIEQLRDAEGRADWQPARGWKHG